MQGLGYNVRKGQSQMFRQPDAELAQASDCLNIWRAKRPRECSAFTRLCPWIAAFPKTNTCSTHEQSFSLCP